MAESTKVPLMDLFLYRRTCRHRQQPQIVLCVYRLTVSMLSSVVGYTRNKTIAWISVIIIWFSLCFAVLPLGPNTTTSIYCGLVRQEEKKNILFKFNILTCKDVEDLLWICCPACCTRSLWSWGHKCPDDIDCMSFVRRFLPDEKKRPRPFLTIALKQYYYSWLMANSRPRDVVYASQYDGARPSVALCGVLSYGQHRPIAVSVLCRASQLAQSFVQCCKLLSVNQSINRNYLSSKTASRLNRLAAYTKSEAVWRNRLTDDCSYDEVSIWLSEEPEFKMFAERR